MYIPFLQMNIDLLDITIFGLGIVYVYLVITNIFTWSWYGKSNKVTNVNNKLILKSASEALLPLDDEGEYEVNLNTMTPSTGGIIKITV